MLETTGSPALTGVTAAVHVLPVIISGALGGAVADRMGLRRASIASDLASAAAVAAIPLLYATAGIALWQLLVLVFLGTLLDVPGGSARVNLVADAAERAGISLERANAHLSAVQRGAQLAGPLIAGVLVALVGPATALWANAASFLLSALLIAAFVPRPAHPAPVEHVTYIGQLRRGIGFVWGDPLTRFILLTVAVGNLLASPAFAVALPVYANQVLGSPIALGILTGSIGAGALVGALAYGAFGDRLPRRATFIAAYAISGIPLATLAVVDDLVVGAAILAFVGLASAPLNPLIVSAVQRRTPAHMRAQVIGTSIALAWIAMPIGMLVAGVLAEAFGVRTLFLIAGAAFAALFVFVLPVRVLRELDASPATASSGQPR